MRKIFFPGAWTAGAVFLATLCLAQAPEENKAEKDLPKSGKLAGSLVSGADSRNVEEPWGGADITGDSLPPITGSVSKQTERSWVMRVFNNSEDTYSVNLEVEQWGARNARLKSDYFSYTLAGKQSAERAIPTLATVSQCTLNLKSWSNLSKRKRDAAKAAGTPAPTAAAR